MTETTTKELYEAVAAVQAEAPKMDKSATNPHFRSKYVPLEGLVEALDPLIEKHGLVFFTAPSYIQTSGETIPALEYRLIHLETNQAIAGSMPLILDKQNSQGVGSAITYARRYILTSLFNVIAELDDDGEKASKPAPKKDESFTDKVRATGKKAAEIREWAASEGFTLDDVGVDSKDLTKFLNDPTKMTPLKQKILLDWAKG